MSSSRRPLARDVSTRLLRLACALAASFALVPAAAHAQARPSCAQEIKALHTLARGVQVNVQAPPSLTAGGRIRVTWNAPTRMPLGSGVELVLAIPGEVRFVTPPPSARPQAAGDDAAREAPPELAGFIALPPSARGPRGMAFGAGRSRALIPLYQPGSRLTGSLDIEVFEAGRIAVEAAVVAVGRCGETVAGGPTRTAVTVAPGRPEIVVQDPYDIERPAKVLVSPSGRYRANIFAGRYRVYDTETGAKLVDRAGHSVNFSPTSRFLAATVGDEGSTVREVIDLASRQVVVKVRGSFIGWTYSDAYLIVGHGSWGRLFVRPTLISRPVAAAAEIPAEAAGSADASAGPEDGLELAHSGSCHACASWTDDNLMLDIDNGILAFTGTFEPDKERVYELASGAALCCAKQGQIEPFVARTYALVPFRMHKGWHAREPIRFTHIYDAEADPDAKHLADQDWFQGAKPLRSQLVEPKTIDPGAKPVEIAGLSGASVVRGDWRSHAVTRGRGQTSAATTRRRITTELGRLGLVAAPALEREQIDMVNSWAGADRRAAGGFGATSADYDRIDAVIAQRTEPLAERLIGEIPALRAHLKRPGEKPKEGYEPPLPLEGLDKGKIDLAGTLEGLWRWQLEGRPLWLLQLWATEGNSGEGEGMIFLLEGDGGGAGGRITDLTKPLEDFWAGAYGSSDHQTRLKPAIYLGRYLVAASVAQKTIVVYDLAGRRRIAVFKDVPQADLMQEAVLTADARHVLQINSDGQFFIHDLASGGVALSGRSVDDEIIVYTGEAYYWSSYEGAHFVQLRFPGLPGLYPFQQFASMLERPDIIKAQLVAGAARPQPPALSPPPTLAVTRPARGEGPAQIAIDARAALGLARLRLYADGQPVKDIALDGREERRRIDMPAVGDAHWLTLQVSDRAGFVSTPQALRLAPQRARSARLRAVLVGIDEYREPRLRLRYAKSDAERLAKALQSSAGGYYAAADIRLLTGAGAGKAAILEALKQAVASAVPGDTVVFSFAGHGDQDKTSGRYFLTPADFDLADAARTGLAWGEIADTLKAAKARVVVILDACHSGLSGAEQLATNDEAVGALLSTTQAPMLVLAASKGRQLSYEDPRWGGGLFTHALVQALSARRADFDADGDGAIEASELYRALKSIVVPQSRGLQTPWLARRDLIGDFALF